MCMQHLNFVCSTCHSATLAKAEAGSRSKMIDHLLKVSIGWVNAEKKKSLNYLFKAEGNEELMGPIAHI